MTALPQYYQDEKASIHQIDNVESDIDRHLAVRLPASLEGLSAEEIAVIDQAATKKLDILLMPVLVSPYIL